MNKPQPNIVNTSSRSYETTNSQTEYFLSQMRDLQVQNQKQMFKAEKSVSHSQQPKSPQNGPTHPMFRQCNLSNQHASQNHQNTLPTLPSPPPPQQYPFIALLRAVYQPKFVIKSIH